jgi:hypothetical protein
MDKIEERIQELKRAEAQRPLTPAELDRLARLELRFHYFPAESKDALPSRLGNILRAGETTPRHKYGLDTFACWPRLWLVIPEHTRQDLSVARQSLLQWVELLAWGVLFALWAIWSPWVLIVSLVWVLFAYEMALQAAMSYADLIEAAFDLHRWELYKEAHWPLPAASGEGEVASGKALTEFFWRGTSAAPVGYAHQGTDDSHG